MLLLALVAVVVVLVWAWWTQRPLRTSDVELWASAYGLTLTAASGPVVVRYLGRSQRWRRTAVLLGYGLLPSALAALGVQLDVPFVLAILSYSAGMVAAAATMPDPLAGVGATAELAPRTVGRYLPARLRWLPRALAAGLVAASVWSLTIEESAGAAAAPVRTPAGAPP